MISQLYNSLLRIFGYPHVQSNSGARSRIYPAVFLSSAIVTGILLIARQLGTLQSLELAAFDSLVRLRPNPGLDSRLLIVEISEADIRQQKQWPLSDLTISKLLANLQTYQPRVIGLDIYRELPKPPGQPELTKQLKAKNLIAIYKNKESDSDTEGILPPDSIPPDRIGFNDLLLDPDGVVRRCLLTAQKKDGEVAYSLALQTALKYLTPPKIFPQPSGDKTGAIQWGKAKFFPLNTNSGSYKLSENDVKGYQILFNYRWADSIANTVNLKDVLAGKIDPNWVRDKIVIIGTTAPSLKDLFFTPYSAKSLEQPKMSGVFVHAQIISHLLTVVLGETGTNQAQKFVLPWNYSTSILWYWPEWAEVLWISAWALTGGIFAWRIQQPLQLVLTGTITLFILWSICLIIALQSGWIPLVPPALALVITGATVLAYKRTYDALHDQLTGLPNRALFATKLERLIGRSQFNLQLLKWLKISKINKRKGDLFAVFFLDIDGFNVINTSLGHLAGDALLVEMVYRLKGCLRSIDTVARVGGDNFAILLENIKDISNASRVAERIHQTLLDAFRLGEQDVFVSVSIGIAVSDINDCRPEHLLRNAHTAMYRAKSEGKGRYQVFDATMHAAAVERLQMETELRLAIKREEFSLVYQPIISLSTGRIIGFEALIRWQHPERGAIRPDKFIPLAEETGLIVQIGAWVLATACRQLSLWLHKFSFDGSLIVNVNLSGKQFSQPNLIEQISNTLKETKLPPNCLKLEITESIVMDDVEAAIGVLQQLQSLGLKLAIDDFGTGYSSLSYLTRFPTDTLKVDKSFVSKMEIQALEINFQETGKIPKDKRRENLAIVRAIITLTHALGMDVVAEGVETAEQLAMLRTLGCEYGQGYYFAKPLSVQDAEELLTSNPQW